MQSSIFTGIVIWIIWTDYYWTVTSGSVWSSTWQLMTPIWNYEFSCRLLFLLIESRRCTNYRLRSIALPDLFLIMVIQTHIVMFRAHEIDKLSIQYPVVSNSTIGSRCCRSGCTLTSIMMRSTYPHIKRWRRRIVLLLTWVAYILNLGFLELLHHHHHLLLLRAWIVAWCSNLIQIVALLLDLWRMTFRSTQVNVSFVWLWKRRIRNLPLFLRVRAVLWLRRWRRWCHWVEILKSSLRLWDSAAFNRNGMLI